MTQNSIERNAQLWDTIFAHFKDRGGGIRQYPMDTVVSWTLSLARTDLHPKRVLDFGCAGSASLIMFLDNGYEYYGVDVTDKAFRDVSGFPADIRDRIELTTAKLPALPHEDNYFSHIVCTEALHLNSSEEAMSEAIDESLRVLKKGGRMLVTTFHPEHWFISRGQVDWVDTNVITVNESCENAYRRGVSYYVFQNEEHIHDMFSQFGKVTIGKESWYFGEQPDRNVAHWIISIEK